ncbi:MAG: hypothetical protein IKE16_02580 [Solobacterium sp.]|nr:hypothetical protein [Solobacterium sp.]
MIFVTLGTNDKPFDRLITAVEKAVEAGTITERVVVQSGFTKYESKRIEIFPYIDRNQFADYMNQADLIVTHGGAGTIFTALSLGKKILGAARRKDLGEHVNDHQTQLLEAFEKDGYLIYMKDLGDITPYLEQAKTFEPRPYVSSRDDMVNLIETWIDKNVK